VGVFTAGSEVARSWARPTAKPARLETRSLSLLGFRPLLRPLSRSALRPHSPPSRQGLWIRPDNLVVGVAGLRQQLDGLAPDAAAGRLVFRLEALDPDAERDARRSWDVAALQRGYARSARELAVSERRLGRLSNDKAMVESFVVGGRVLRQLVLDPLLPEPICATASRRALVESMLRYDRLGRKHWRDFLDAHDLPQRGRARRRPAVRSLAGQGEPA
jgi:phenylacetic acid degradation operon negative regulatory protein